MTMTHDQLHTHGPDELAMLRAECDKWHKAYDRVWEERMRFADRAIELEKENKELKARIQLDDDEMAGFLQLEEECGGGDLRNYIAELKQKLEDAKATHNAEMVDAGMRERRLRRALWISRAKAYRYIAELIACFNPDYVRNRKMFTPNNLKQKQMNSLKWARLMLKIESKCRAKAEEYK